MSSNVVFTDSEQIRLQELTATQNQFEAFKQLLLRGTYAGNDSRLVLEAFNFFEGMSQQVKQQIQLVTSSASERKLKAVPSTDAPKTIPTASKKKGTK